MNTNIYKHEFRARLTSVITWSLGILLLIVFFLSLYPSFSGQVALVNEMLAKFPPQLLEAFGLGKMDLSSLLGFYAFLFIFIQLCIAIQAANYGFGLVSVEETELTADFLLSKPVSRLQVLNSKMLAALSSLLLTDVIVWAVTFFSIMVWGKGHPYQEGTLILLLVSALIFQLFFLGVGLLISLLVRRVRSVTPYALGLAFGAYIINGFSGVFGDVALEYITPFKHFDPTYIVLNGAYDTPLVLLNVAVTIVALGASYWLYIHRDIPAVS